MTSRNAFITEFLCAYFVYEFEWVREPVVLIGLPPLEAPHCSPLLQP